LRCRVGGRPIEQWERDWIGTINTWVLKIDKFAFYKSMKNDFAQDKKELKAVLEGLSGTMQRSERHNIMKEMRTISEVSKETPVPAPDLHAAPLASDNCAALCAASVAS
jgi:hypothetical protein